MTRAVVGVPFWAIVCDTSSAHEADCVYSVWTTLEGAERELNRLNNSNVQRGCYNGDFHVVEFLGDTSRDEWIE